MNNAELAYIKGEAGPEAVYAAQSHATTKATTSAEELARLRHLNVNPQHLPQEKRPPVRVQRDLYEDNIAVRGWKPDPKREVLEAWPETSFDQGHTALVICANGTQLPTNPIPSDKFRVRWLCGTKLGQVEDIGVIEYLFARDSAEQRPSAPDAEPVPKTAKLCGPEIPPNLPSDYNKARSAAARALGKGVETITDEQIHAHYRKLLESKKRR